MTNQHAGAVRLTADEIIKAAISEHKPAAVFALFSGGDDSVCAAHLAAPYMTAAVMIDTGIAVEATHIHARATADKMGWPFLVYKSPYQYDDTVKKYGFPGPHQHRIMYIILKERAVRALIRDSKKSRNDRVLLITGVRKQESARRMETVKAPIVSDGAAVWCAPMWEWSNRERDQYIDTNNLPRNPVKPILHVSGDCLCGAYAQKGELSIMRVFYPNEYARIKKLQDEVTARFPWGWEDGPPEWWGEYKAGQKFLSSDFMPLCWACERNQVQS